ncbi:hypothetical protein N9P38_00055 [Flavobacteriales bacterium]|nr:hypothetical protein [Flavobacteriales bacterium]
MTNDILDDFSNEEITKAPTGLIVLSILTFIWNALLFLGITVGVGVGMSASRGVSLPSGAIVVFTIIIALCVLNTVGAAKMLKLKKSGFWMYLVSNIVYIVFFIIAIFGISQAPKNGVNTAQLNTSFGMIIIFTLALIVMTFLFSSYSKKFK